jgi:hypothetical protein
VNACANCSRPLGKLEDPHRYRGQPVCGECFARLAKPNTTRPALLTMLGFFPFIYALFYSEQKIQLHQHPGWDLITLVIVGGIVTVVGLTWFVVVRLRRDR